MTFLNVLTHFEGKKKFRKFFTRKFWLSTKKNPQIRTSKSAPQVAKTGVAACWYVLNLVSQCQGPALVITCLVLRAECPKKIFWACHGHLWHFELAFEKRRFWPLLDPWKKMGVVWRHCRSQSAQNQLGTSLEGVLRHFREKFFFWKKLNKNFFWSKSDTSNQPHFWPKFWSKMSQNDHLMTSAMRQWGPYCSSTMP